MHKEVQWLAEDNSITEWDAFIPSVKNLIWDVLDLKRPTEITPSKSTIFIYKLKKKDVEFLNSRASLFIPFLNWSMVYATWLGAILPLQCYRL